MYLCIHPVMVLGVRDECGSTSPHGARGLMGAGGRHSGGLGQNPRVQGICPEDHKSPACDSSGVE